MHRVIELRSSVFAGLAFMGLAGVVLFARSLGAVQSAPAAEASPQFYTEHVQPIFQANCYRCHAGLNHRGGLQIDTRAALMHGGKHGTAVVPGHPEQSLLVKLIRHDAPGGDPKPMPPKSMLSAADIATITEWIRGGAVMPPDRAQ